jgi:sulfoxide reductase heme-binding subunit YedZ
MRTPAAKPILWLLLALPAAWMAARLAQGTMAMKLIEPSGETAVRLLILALLPGPLAEAFGTGRVLRWWLRIRRNLGVAAFCYGLLHLGFYAIDMGQVAGMLDELDLPGIWTGWLALALLIPPAAISFDRAVRALARRWRQVQYLVYAALCAVFAHWLLLEWSWIKAVVHILPLILAWSLRAWRRVRPHQPQWSMP